MEQWERWNSRELVADDYELKSLVQDWEGLTLVFLGRKTEVTIVYHEQLLSFRSCDEGDRVENPSTQYWRITAGTFSGAGWLYKVSESDYASWFSRETFGSTAVDKILHLAFVTANDIIDVLSLREPSVTISCIS